MSKATKFLKKFDEVMEVDLHFTEIIKRPLTTILYNWGMRKSRQHGSKWIQTDDLGEELNREFYDSGKYPFPIAWDRGKPNYKPGQRRRQRYKRKGAIYKPEYLVERAFVENHGLMVCDVAPSFDPQYLLDTLRDQVVSILSSIRHEYTHMHQLVKAREGTYSNKTFTGSRYKGGKFPHPSGFKSQVKRAPRNIETGEKYPVPSHAAYMSKANEIDAYAREFVYNIIEFDHSLRATKQRKPLPNAIFYPYANYSRFGLNSPIYKSFIKKVVEEATKRQFPIERLRIYINDLERGVKKVYGPQYYTY